MKNIGVATVAKRMNRILAAYHEQNPVNEEDTVPEQSTSTPTSTFGQMTYSTDRGLEVHKKLLNYATKNNSSSESETSDDSDSGRIRSGIQTRSQAVKRTAKIKATPLKRKQRKVSSKKVTSTITSASLATISSDTDSDDANTTILIKTRSKKSTPIDATPIKASESFNQNDNRQVAQ